MKLAVIGDPVAHSRSPRLHRVFLAEAGIDGTYDAIRVPKDNGISVVRRMRMDDYTGVNVTYPLKEEVLRACDAFTEEATRAQAVNTIFFGREILGHNTDGIGARGARNAARRRLGCTQTHRCARLRCDRARNPRAAARK